MGSWCIQDEGLATEPSSQALHPFLKIFIFLWKADLYTEWDTERSVGGFGVDFDIAQREMGLGYVFRNLVGLEVFLWYNVGRLLMSVLCHCNKMPERGHFIKRLLWAYDSGSAKSWDCIWWHLSCWQSPDMRQDTHGKRQVAMCGFVCLISLPPLTKPPGFTMKDLF